MKKMDKRQLPLVLGVVAAAIMIVSVERGPASWAGAVAGFALWVASVVWAIRQTNEEGKGCKPES